MNNLSGIVNDFNDDEQTTMYVYDDDSRIGSSRKEYKVIYSKILLDNIEKEKMGVDYCYPVEDKLVLNELFKEINAYLGTNISYLAEIDAFDIKGAGNIMVRYISKISSESVRGFLIPQIAADKVPDCSQLILQLYQHFKESDEYIAKPRNPAPSHVYVRYDNAFAALRHKKL